MAAQTRVARKIGAPGMADNARTNRGAGPALAGDPRPSPRSNWRLVTQQHGGTIAVDSRVGEFTEFTIHLPRAGQATTATTTEAAA
jgi:hypothetical protein